MATVTLRDRMRRDTPLWREIVERSTPLFDMAIVAGAVAGDVAVAGIKAGDILQGVVPFGGVPGTGATQDRVTAGTPALAIGSTDTNVATGAVDFVINGAFNAKAAVAAGTALAAGTIPADTWGVYRLVIGANGTIDVLPAAANFTTGYASEALAIAALPAITADHADLGYLAVLTKVGEDFIGTTDSLEGGAAGNVSSDTNYYSASLAAPDVIGTNLRSEFSVVTDGIINNASGTSTLNQDLLVLWMAIDIAAGA